jgi:16S rRNA processing protein RimM
VLGPHGVNGEIRCAVLTDFPERFKRASVLHVGESYAPCQVERARLSKGGLLLKLRDVESREAAAALRGHILFVPAAEAMPLPKGSYYWHEIIGLEVRTTDGRSLGSVTEILETGSNDVYVVRDEGHEVLVPAIAEVVRDVDVAGGIITVELIEGLT